MSFRQDFKILAQGGCGVAMPVTVKIHVVVIPRFHQLQVDIIKNHFDIVRQLIHDLNLCVFFERHLDEGINDLPSGLANSAF